MKFQKDDYSCGVFAVLNGARAMGVRLSERAIRAHTATKKDEGTSNYGILNALERLGFEGRDFLLPQEDAYQKVHDSVASGSSVLLCVEEENHWVAVVGTCGKKVVTFDSWKSKANQAEAGVDVWDKRSLKYWWTPAGGKFYGIVMGRAK